MPPISAGIIGPADPLWIDVLDSTSHDIYHLPRYSEIEADRLTGEPVAAFVEQGDCRLLIPLILRPLPAGVEGVDAVSPYGYPGPLLSPAALTDSDFIEAAGAAAAAALGDAGCAAAFIRCHPLLSQPENLFAQQADLREVGSTAWLDLELSAEDRWATMNPKVRGTLRRTLRNGFVAEIDERWEALDAFIDIYTSTMNRVDAAPYYYFDREYFMALHHELEGRIHLVVVRQGDEVVGAGLFTEESEIVQYHLSGTMRISGRSPSAVMLDYVGDWASDRGNKVLHLGGGLGGDDDSLFRFKSGFAPERARFTAWPLVTDRSKYDAACAATPGIDLTPEAESHGYFPPYRAV